MLDKNINEDHLQETIKKMLKDAAGSIASPTTPNGNGQPDAVTMVSQVAASLEEGMMEIYKGLNTLGQGLDLSRLQNFMVVKILVDKGIVTEKEIEELYKTEVADKLEEMHKRMQKQMEQQIQGAINEVPNTENKQEGSK